MALDVTTPPRPVAVPTAVHRRRAWLLLGLAVFQFWLWGTRIVNLVGDDTQEFTPGFVAVHLVLYTAAIGAGVVLAVLGWLMRREAIRAGDRTRVDRAA